MQSIPQAKSSRKVSFNIFSLASASLIYNSIEELWLRLTQIQYLTRQFTSSIAALGSFNSTSFQVRRGRKMLKTIYFSACLLVVLSLVASAYKVEKTVHPSLYFVDLWKREFTWTGDFSVFSSRSSARMLGQRGERFLPVRVVQSASREVWNDPVLPGWINGCRRLSHERTESHVYGITERLCEELSRLLSKDHVYGPNSGGTGGGQCERYSE